ncbi:MAG: hypothetical protein KBD31_03445 [Proteobacteria bacterium]|nr:hypothetical protein [Pseudomonadota bacterium]
MFNKIRLCSLFLSLPIMAAERSPEDVFNSMVKASVQIAEKQTDQIRTHYLKRVEFEKAEEAVRAAISQLADYSKIWEDAKVSVQKDRYDAAILTFIDVLKEEEAERAHLEDKFITEKDEWLSLNDALRQEYFVANDYVNNDPTKILLTFGSENEFGTLKTIMVDKEFLLNHFILIANLLEVSDSEHSPNTRIPILSQETPMPFIYLFEWLKGDMQKAPKYLTPNMINLVDFLNLKKESRSVFIQKTALQVLSNKRITWTKYINPHMYMDYIERCESAAFQLLVDTLTQKEDTKNNLLLAYENIGYIDIRIIKDFFPKYSYNQSIISIWESFTKNFPQIEEKQIFPLLAHRGRQGHYNSDCGYDLSWIRTSQKVYVKTFNQCKSYDVRHIIILEVNDELLDLDVRDCQILELPDNISRIYFSRESLSNLQEIWVKQGSATEQCLVRHSPNLVSLIKYKGGLGADSNAV